MKPFEPFEPRATRFFQRVYELVREISPGRVASYGQIARLLGKGRGARSVGWAMRALPENSGVPWHRVVNARGDVRLVGRAGDLQRALLEAEGVVLDKSGRISMRTYAWEPEDSGEDEITKISNVIAWFEKYRK